MASINLTTVKCVCVCVFVFVCVRACVCVCTLFYIENRSQSKFLLHMFVEVYHGPKNVFWVHARLSAIVHETISKEVGRY